MLEPGDEIDIWVIDKRLGSGGMGSVYKCHNRNATRILAAVKVLEVGGSRAPGAQERFVREAEILYTLDHANVVQVRNVRIDHDPPYLEMEFVKGESIEDKLQRGAIEFDTAMDYMAQFAEAVAYLHGIGVRHRDLKPANLMVRKEDDRVKVCDFGLAMESDVTRITQAGMTFGTVSYAPPEWVSPDQLDPALWDLYAMGVCFWEMLTGKVAFPVSGQGSARQQAMQVILSKQSHPPLDPGEEYHADLRRIVAQLTQSDPRKRPQDAAKVAKVVRNLTRSLRRAAGDTLLPPKEDLDELTAQALAEVEDERFERHETDTWIMDPSKSDVPAPKREEQPDTVLRPEANKPVPTPAPPPDTLGAPVVTSEIAAPTSATGAGMAVGAAAGAGVAVAIAAVFAIVAVLAAIGGFVWITMGGGSTRPVDVVVSGLPAGTPFVLQLADAPAGNRDGFIYHFESVPSGRVQVAWSVGDNCPLTTCPGNDCPAWCGSESRTEVIEDGDGLKTLALTVDPPQLRKVRVLTPKVDSDHEVSFAIAGHSGKRVGPQSFEYELKPGLYPMVATTGTCPEDALGCTERADCPKGCASWASDLVVEWGKGQVAIDIDVTNPATKNPSGGTTAPPPDKEPVDQGTGEDQTPPVDNGGTDPQPAPDPVEAHPEPDPKDPPPDPGNEGTAESTGAAAKPVTTSQFAGWLASHSDWSAEAAVAANRATADYLTGWSGTEPPAGAGAQPMVNVSWYAASAYCKGRGGLALIDAEPHSWSESHYLEWRTAGGKPAWRSTDGQQSTAVRMADSNAMTGFRCAR